MVGLNLMPKSPKAQLMRGIYAVSAVGLFYLALTDIPLADATALIFITPIVVTILSPFMLKEHVGVRRWVAVILGFGGVPLICTTGFPGGQNGYAGRSLYRVFIWTVFHFLASFG